MYRNIRILKKFFGEAFRYSLLILPILLFFQSCSQKGKQYPAYNKLNKVKPEDAIDSVYSGAFSVVENRSSNSGKKISISVTVIPAIRQDSLLQPIFYLEGGPGVAASTSLSYFSMPENIYRQNHDIVLVDFRGTGNSNPLHCSSLQNKKDLNDQFAEMYPVSAVKECFDSLSRYNDLTQYTTENIVKDLEDIRTWLGYEKVNLYGLSYGTRVAQVYMRMFPDAINSVVLMSPVKMDIKMPLYHARNAQEALNLLFEDCKNDSACHFAFPDLKNDFEKLMEGWKTTPKIYSWTDSKGQTKNVLIPWHAFHTKIRSLSYSPAGMRIIPFLIHESYKGDLKPFADLFPKENVIDNFLAEGMYLCITCSEDVPFISTSEVSTYNENTFMGSYRIDQQKRACSLWSHVNISIDFLQPVQSEIPVLIISGKFDPVTAPAWAREIAQKLPNATVVTIPAMAHLFDGLTNEDCLDHLVVDFFMHPDKPQLDVSCVENMSPPPYKTN